MTIVIPNFNKFIKTRKGMKKDPGKKGLARGGKVRPFFLPPVNTNPTLGKLKLQKISKTKLARAIIIPPVYDLMTDPKYEGRIIQCGDRSVAATSQFQQYSCGSCWAYAVATCISDAFVVANNLAFNPRLSWTYLLSCAPHGSNPSTNPAIQTSAQCGGGDVASALTWVQENGIASSSCVDYSWCVSNPECTGASTDATALNALIPSCGCYFAGAFLKYKIKNVNRICLGDCANPKKPITETEIITFRNIIRQHIIQYGPVIGALILMSNIVDQNPQSGITGDFKTSKNPEGVYLECVGVGDTINTTLPAVENESDQCIVQGASPKPNSILGGHAVAIVGWGIAPVHASLINPDLRTKNPPDANGMIMVPYWRVRNSWGDQYADKGNYNHAMYPFNKVSQIDKTVMIVDPSTRSTIFVGGCALFQPDGFETSTFQQNNGKGKSTGGTSVIEQGGSGVNTGLFPGKSSTGSSAGSESAASSKLAFSPLYQNPPEENIPQYVPPISTTSIPAMTTFFPSMSEASLSVKKISRGQVIAISVSVSVAFIIICAIAGYFLYKRYHPATPTAVILTGSPVAYSGLPSSTINPSTILQPAPSLPPISSSW